MTNTPLPNAECAQLDEALRKALSGPDAAILARSITLCLWNMICAAVEQQKEELKR